MLLCGTDLLGCGPDPRCKNLRSIRFNNPHIPHLPYPLQNGPETRSIHFSRGLHHPHSTVYIATRARGQIDSAVAEVDRHDRGWVDSGLRAVGDVHRGRTGREGVSVVGRG
jgi:hypothetical protein